MSEHPPDGFTTTRTIAASPERVWHALVDAESFASWFGTEHVAVPLSTLRWDAREGSEWSAQMVLPDGATIDWEGEFVRVDQPRELAFTITDDATNPQRDDVVFTLTASDGGGCALTLAQSGGGLSPDQYEQAAAGWAGFVDVIEQIATR